MIRITARAKINLTLDVLGTLPDGYHEVATVMQALDFHDTLEIRGGTYGLTLSSNSKAIPLGDDNLVFKAFEHLIKYAGPGRGVHIHIHKNIPMAAGLGGGSSNAAAALVGLNRFLELGLTTDVLMEIGSHIGADVPFFIMGKTALGTGKGDKLIPLSSPPTMGVVLVKPHFGVSTAQVYKMFDSLSYVPEPRTGLMIEAINNKSIKNIAANLGNALEPVTASLHPQIHQIKRVLTQAGALGVQMSGSGPTVFALTESKNKAEELARHLNKDNMTVLVTKTVLE